MAGPFQLTLAYNDIGLSEGFSEVYFINVGDYASAATHALAIRNASLSIKCVDVYLAFARLSDVTVRGDSYPLNWGSSLGPTAGVGTWVTGTDKSMPLWNALLMRWYNPAFQANSHYFHGVPTLQVTAQVYAPTTAFTTALSAAENVIIANAAYRQVRSGVVSYTTIQNILTEGVTSRKTGAAQHFIRGRRRVV